MEPNLADGLLGALLTQGPLALVLGVALWAATWERPAWVPGAVHRERMAAKDAEIARLVADYTREVADVRSDTAAAIARAERWERIALSTTSLASTVVDMAREAREERR